MELRKYYIIESIESEKVDFGQIPGYSSFETSRKSQDLSLFLIKLNEGQSTNFLDNVELKWGPFNAEELEYIFLEPTWRRNIYIK